MVSAAWADDQLTADEWADIQKIDGLLEIDAETLGGAASKPDAAAPTLTTGFRLSPGDTVVITGDTRRDRSAWFDILTQRGLIAKDSMVTKAKVLVAADPDSMSGKARQARDWGVPIITEEGLERLLGLDAAAKKGYRGAWMMTSAAWCACLPRGRGSRPSSPARALDNPSSGRPANPLAHTVADVALGMYAVARYDERDDTSLPNADIGPGCRTSPSGCARDPA